MSDLTVTTRHVGTVAVLDLTGEVEVYTHQRLKQALADLQNAGHHVIVLNLAGVPYMDSMGLGVLIGALKKAREHRGRIVLVGATPPVRKSLHITGLVLIFELWDSEAEAVASFEREAA